MMDVSETPLGAVPPVSYPNKPPARLGGIVSLVLGINSLSRKSPQPSPALVAPCVCSCRVYLGGQRPLPMPRP